jgi:hypothetical protein
MKKKNGPEHFKTLLASVVAYSLLLTVAHAAQLIGVSVPVNSATGTSLTNNSGIWAVSTTPPTPLDVNSGVGNLVNPTDPASFNASTFVLHNATSAPMLVTYEWDSAVTVSSILMKEHGNGITEIEGFVGNDLGSMSSVGIIAGALGDVSFSEGQSNLFTINSPISGKYFQWRITDTTAANTSYALYRAIPNATAAAVPEPSGFVISALLLCALKR